MAHNHDERPLAAMRTYVIGNSVALMVGLLAAYWALKLSGSAIINLRDVDFMGYFSTARLILQGHGGSIYDLGTLSHVQTQLAGTNSGGSGVLIVLYPPYFSLLMVPFALLPYGVAYVLWLGVDCVLLAFGMYALEQYIGLDGRSALFFRSGSLAFLPVFMALILGQTAIFLFALFVGAFFAARNGHPAVAGASLAVASLKPAYIAPLLLVFLLRREWRALAAYACTLACLLAAAAPVLGPQVYGSYLNILRAVSGWQGRSIERPLSYHHTPVSPANYTPEWNHSLAGFSELLLRSPASVLLLGILVTAALALLIHATFKWSSIEVPLGMAVVVGLMLSPHTLAYDLTLLLIPAAVAVRYRGAGIPHLLVFLAFLYWAVTVGYKLAFFVPVQLSVIAMSALLVWTWAIGWRSGWASEGSNASSGGSKVPDTLRPRGTIPKPLTLVELHLDIRQTGPIQGGSHDRVRRNS